MGSLPRHSAMSSVDALVDARRLLRTGETEIAAAVARTVEYLAGRGIWYQLSRNPRARSCREAAHSRHRLGHVGIPLWDELKSFFGQFTDQSGRRRYVLAHCRADHLLDFDALGSALHAVGVPERMDAEHLLALGMEYGLVNPFDSWVPVNKSGVISTTVVQVFDTDLLRPVGVPGTVMTNAGDLSWGVEVWARDLFDRVEDAMEADVSIPDSEESVRPPELSLGRSIRIITGNAPEAGIALWHRIGREVRDHLGPACSGDISMPPVTVESLRELGMSLELHLRHEEIWAALRGAVVNACRDGVRFLSLACNTTHYFTPQIRSICAGSDTEFVSMPEVLGEWLRAEGIERVALLGLSYVADLDAPWSAYRDPLEGIHVEKLRPRAFERLADLAYRVKAKGVSENLLGELRAFLRQEVESPHVVLALTELSALVASQRKLGQSDRVIIDPLALYGQALARQWLA